MAFRFNLSRSIAVVSLLLIAGCSSSPPQSSQSSVPITASTPQASPKPIESPIVAAPQSIPPAPIAPPASPDSESISSKGSRSVEKCVIRMAKVNDPESPLNLRSSPDASSKTNIVGQLPNGAFVDVEDEQNGWFRISGEKPGWIAKSKTESNCSEKIERIQLGQDGIEIRDRFIGVGSHQYRIRLNQGQKFTVSRDRAVFPRITAPDGKDLVDYKTLEERKSWTGEVPATGDYSIVFESNYKGYEYGVFVEAR